MLEREGAHVLITLGSAMTLNRVSTSAPRVPCRGTTNIGTVAIGQSDQHAMRLEYVLAF